MLYIFDLDSTLVVRFKTQPLDGVLERLVALKAQQHEIAVATNQAGMAWRVSTGSAKFPDPKRLAVRFARVARRLPQVLSVPWFIAIHDSRVDVPEEDYTRLADELDSAAKELNLQISAEPDWRKPGSGMLQAAMHWYGSSTEETVFVGDMETDAQAAAAAGIAFVYAEDFFKDDAAA